MCELCGKNQSRGRVWGVLVPLEGMGLCTSCSHEYHKDIHKGYHNLKDCQHLDKRDW